MTDDHDIFVAAEALLDAGMAHAALDSLAPAFDEPGALAREPDVRRTLELLARCFAALGAPNLETACRDAARDVTDAEALHRLGFLLVVLGFTMYGASILRSMQQVQVADENTDPQDIQLLRPMGILGLGLFLLGSVLLIVGIVLHIVASARRRRVDRDMPPTFPRRPY